MKPKTDKISIISVLIILFLISIPGFLAYHLTDEKNNNILQDASQRISYPEFQEDSKFLNNRLLLRKDKGITIKRNKLVFKGFKDQVIHLDVYLLELDPESAYPFHISKADALKGIRFGDLKFQFLKVNKKTLQLKYLDGRQS